jgi:RNA polymerase sigma factor (sigma-70 family)
LKALIEDFACADTTDAQLATAARRGSQPAFEALFRRYRPRITAFVRGSVPDDGRVDDVVQEVFVSALRNLGTLETPDAFAPWLHRIARNACIDHLRRVSREEIAIDSHLLEAAEGRPLRPPAQSIHGHVSSKEDIEHLRQAFGELPAAQHQALVLRELEGLSYDEIGRRLSLSRPAVESILFRARRGLKGEFAEISTGARCLQVRAAMAGWAEGIGGGRERRVAMRHLRTCQGCRREAAAMGLHGIAHQAAQAGSLRRVVDRAAALVPLPVFLFRRDTAASGEAGAGAGAGASGFSTQAQTALVQMSAAGHAGADQAASLAQKAVAVVATVAVVGGGGMAVKHSGIPVSFPNVVSSHGTKQDSAAVRPDGLPTDPRKAAEVLYGGQGPLPAGAKKPALVVPALVLNALPQAPVGGDVTGPPGQPPETALGGSSPAVDGGGGTVPGSSSDGSPAAGVPDVAVPVTTPVTAVPVDAPATNGNGNGNGNGKAKGHDKKADSAPVSEPPVTDPVANPVPPPVDPPAPPVLDTTGAPINPAILQSMEAGNSGKIPPGQLKKITGTKKT